MVQSTTAPYEAYRPEPHPGTLTALAADGRHLRGGIDEDLQLLALARPTDAAIRRWNGWTTARHRPAQAELVAAGAVLTGRRARAGRTAFVPGEWPDAKAPHLPPEFRNLASHLATASGKDLHAPFLRLLPPVPPHELFERARAGAAGHGLSTRRGPADSHRAPRPGARDGVGASPTSVSRRRSP
ncbi:MAG TPA: hypothetical protein VE614_25340 [Streptomyces sp.]|nr:hypothetical protein [Streptomyces sp.]HZF91644.1 hypothetical protein [Streptomyces sp.]